MFNRFDRIPARDGRTDILRQLSPRGKKNEYSILLGPNFYRICCHHVCRPAEERRLILPIRHMAKSTRLCC